MGSINQFLKQIGTGDQIHDFQHGARLFVDDNYRLSPKYGFMFHVKFDLNSEITRMPRDEMLEAGMLVKSINLPKFSIDTRTLNAYNRPNITQTKIKYDSVNITFHDDSADVVLDFWKDYYSYYYRDADYSQPKTDAVAPVYSAPHKYNDRQSQVWGYTPRQYPSTSPNISQLVRAIRIYSLHQKRFTEYVLVNPVITSFQHGEHIQGQNELMQHTMTIAYESVLYFSGKVKKSTVPGFADLHYDNSPSPLTPAGGGTNSILGPGGILDATDEITDDIADQNYLAAIFKGYRMFEKNKGVNLKGLAIEELRQLGTDILRGGGSNMVGRYSFPSLNDLAGKISKGGSGLLATLGLAGGVDKAGGLTDGALLASLKNTATGIKSSVGGMADSVSRSLSGITSNGGEVTNPVPVLKVGTYDEFGNPVSPFAELPLDNADGSTTTSYTDGSSITEFGDGTTITDAPPVDNNTGYNLNDYDSYA